MFAYFSLIVIIIVRGMVHKVLLYAEVDLEAGNSHPFVDLRELGLLTREEDVQDPPPKYEHIEALPPAYDQIVRISTGTLAFEVDVSIELDDDEDDYDGPW